MPYYLVVSKDHNCWTQESKPVITENIETLLPFSTCDDATMAKDLFYAYKPVQRDNTEKYAALEADIETQAKVIQQLTERNDALRVYSKSLMRCYLQLARVAKTIMAQLSVQTILQKTHRERNEELRDIVRDIDDIVSKPIDAWLREVQENSDVFDDIPF